MLSSATDLLCENLDPSEILERLHAQGVLSTSDVENVNSQGSRDQKVETLLDILKTKPTTKYDCFMNALQEIDGRLYELVKGKEEEVLGERTYLI